MKTVITCDHEQNLLAKEVFLSHSGKQKFFVRQLNRDFANHGVSCFFNQDRESLPLGEDFPSRIFEAGKTCKVAVFLLSKDFLESKWPMLELSACVEARDRTRTNPDLKILPLFFQISPDALKDTKVDNENWKQLKISGEKQAEWLRDLELIRRINGINSRENDDEVKFRDDIVKEIWHILPTPSPRYPVHCMQRQERMCQEVADFFKSVQYVKKGTSIAGLYGIPGQGKTTLAKALRNFKMGDFEGKVCHLEFSRGDSFERTKLALQYLTRCPQLILQTLTDRDQAQVELYRRVKGQRVLLVLDNVTEESIDEVTDYLKAELGENSCILLSARSVDVLEKHFKIGKRSCMRRPKALRGRGHRNLVGKGTYRCVNDGGRGKTFCCQVCRQIFVRRGRSERSNISSVSLKSFRQPPLQ
ncbi:disease resistance-like protein CSA1 isoform X2 [Cryptomeria japonica]|uniref:disease resistance-like protein CSA1 isoform X2 n=1 Tax=Cryptomeria japonica TaxID=3369 RepID=UPI0025AD66F1|nr:disease resistance-like protein CSA1 isoform X2 [Cryptomeria japonica]XP_057845448.1 disease resistance-like protein CSA1 isoform X2 [Cryptomeria japonica]XP_057845449.1 disease resistance-like protein CSA1 isoform X2 [Cryptomeria japonica]XP_057845450.1 disease resistance-like protein CSA1 isoform X2 [Cryptomeria japonica]